MAAFAASICNELRRLAESEPGGYFHKWPCGKVSLELDGVDLAQFAGRAVRGTLMAGHSASDVIRAAEERLESARFGLADMKQPQRAHSGFYNAVVFGRMVTFALQNLRSIIPEFDQWYAPKQEQLRADPLARYFYELLTTEIEKKVGRHTSISGYVRSLAQMISKDVIQPHREPRDSLLGIKTAALDGECRERTAL